MSYWNFSFLMTLLWLSAILFACGLIRRVFPSYAKLGMPDCMLAGVLGLVLGRSGREEVAGVAAGRVDEFETDLCVGTRDDRHACIAVARRQAIGGRNGRDDLLPLLVQWIRTRAGPSATRTSRS